ncbi:MULTISPECIES: nickel pincer cofactor biosynthesis protein LarB [Desulfitobacterium]|uniref:NCAIR mutase-like protein n=1 Tax=Desulfitobacterium dehalogenans (strain ATCC 51507 / DSM 9161 / JW/IU-DC1) TaxID=756499 RepID=I4A9R3_DESDJ|nr:MULTISPECIES: nickel pincer cofactor biosynthesis protein LarB [Desulfitobacterium]AFM00698.1 NCAIR mutase-like protein [Desulfitobacterium dehalogenans ATCC 51507]
MNEEQLRALLQGVKDGKISCDSAFLELKNLPYEDLGFAKVDHHRALRNGFPEVVFCQGKAKEHIIEILTNLLKHGHNILATRATPEVYEAVQAHIPEASYSELARVITVLKEPILKRGRVLILSAGTADLPVAEEAAITAEIMGCQVERLYDVGVAGIHRLLDNKDKLNDAQVLIVVAGMEGALASVVGGLTDKPVIAVPTSVGYGASFGGLAALLAMLNSCSAGIGVVNIDNGFGAGVLANSIIRAIVASEV